MILQTKQGQGFKSDPSVSASRHKASLEQIEFSIPPRPRLVDLYDLKSGNQTFIPANYCKI